MRMNSKLHEKIIKSSYCILPKPLQLCIVMGSCTLPSDVQQFLKHSSHYWSQKSITSVNYLSKWQQKQTWFSAERTSHAVYFNDLFSTSFFAAEKKSCLFKVNLWDKKKQNAENGFFKWRFAPKKPSQLQLAWLADLKNDLRLSLRAPQIINFIYYETRRESSHMIRPLAACIALRNSFTCNHIYSFFN